MWPQEFLWCHEINMGSRELLQMWATRVTGKLTSQLAHLKGTLYHNTSQGVEEAANMCPLQPA